MHTSIFQKLICLQLFTDLFLKDFSSLVRINCSYFVLLSSCLYRGGFVHNFTGQINSENDYQSQ